MAVTELRSPWIFRVAETSALLKRIYSFPDDGAQDAGGYLKARTICRRCNSHFAVGEHTVAALVDGELQLFHPDCLGDCPALDEAGLAGHLAKVLGVSSLSDTVRQTRPVGRSQTILNGRPGNRSATHNSESNHKRAVATQQNKPRTKRRSSVNKKRR